MTAPHYDLQTIQRWMQSVITCPAGVEAGMESDAARELINLPPAEIEQIVNRSEKLDAVRRMEVYSAAYFIRLLECMRSEYPILAATMGETVFDRFVVGYLNAHPSKSYSLGHLGAEFPEYLRETAPRDDEQFATWADFVIDLATLEWTFNEVFDGPGAEREQKLTGEQLSQIPPQSWPSARLITVPCLRLLAFSHPVNRFFTEKRNDPQTAVPDPEQTYLGITRRNYIVRRFDLSRTEYELLIQLAAGATVQTAIEQAAEYFDGDWEQFPADLHGWFRGWSAEEIFLRVETP